MGARSLVVATGLMAAFGTAPAMAQPAATPLAERVAAVIRTSEHFTIFDDIYVSVSEQGVRLNGVVTTERKRTELADAVAALNGVGELRNDLRVLSASPVDANLRTRVARAVYGHASFWHYAAMARPPIHIIVERGRITLTGVVATAAERTLAYSLAQVDGAAGVTNELRLER